jgi:exodeoxyribonuclease-3
MRIATWNVNSIRARSGRVVDWMVREDIDVLAMQEIKCKPEQFPAQAFEDAGYELAIHGFSQWNGVAFASRYEMTDVATTFPGMPGFLKGEEGPDLPREARALGVTVNELRLWSLYVPNGRALGDPHYVYKLDWLAGLREHARDSDVGDPTLIPGVSTHISPPERAAFAAFEGAGLHDVVRPLVPEGFTYWDYKQLRFPRNEGLRIDFILGSPAFADLVTGASIHRNERKGDTPSDHVPVVVELDIEGEDDDRPMIF